MFVGAATAIRERLMGRVAWWRTLPAPPIELITGRLAGAGLCGLLFPLSLLPACTAALRSGIVLPG
ncbi:MAG TPA: hypothetical protein PLL69_04490, partial [Gemmatimonadales bacterium]|nr:hypothetical protein [Gemmatimonadales bacterium]